MFVLFMAKPAKNPQNTRIAKAGLVSRVGGATDILTDGSETSAFSKLSNEDFFGPRAATMMCDGI